MDAQKLDCNVMAQHLIAFIFPPTIQYVSIVFLYISHCMNGCFLKIDSKG